MRLDQYLVEVIQIESRSKAQKLIAEGCVMVNQKLVNKSSFEITEEVSIEILPSKELRYVSIGGLKLEKAIQDFQLDFKDVIVLDIGASTGGFTDCAIQHGAEKVVAIDVGSNQLHPSLQNHPKVLSMEQTDIRDVETLPYSFDYIVVDVSFIKLEHIIPSLQRFSNPNTKIVVLVKPQFENTTHLRFKKGIIKDAKTRLKLLDGVKAEFLKGGFQFLNETTTEADGKTKNIEFLCLLTKI
ncbi:MAG: TlyA family RNA methyltransferase [Cytophagaceae bacterium]